MKTSDASDLVLGLQSGTLGGGNDAAESVSSESSSACDVFVEDGNLWLICKRFMDHCIHSFA